MRFTRTMIVGLVLCGLLFLSSMVQLVYLVGRDFGGWWP